MFGIPIVGIDSSFRFFCVYIPVACGLLWSFESSSGFRLVFDSLLVFPDSGFCTLGLVWDSTFSRVVWGGSPYGSIVSSRNGGEEDTILRNMQETGCPEGWVGVTNSSSEH